MKKMLLACLCTSILFVQSHAVETSERNLTVEDTLTLYFETLLPEDNKRYTSVKVRYSGVERGSEFHRALQKAIFHGLIENKSGSLYPERVMPEKAFEALLKRHFGYWFEANNGPLTLSEFQEHTDAIRSTFAFQLIQDTNAQLGAESASLKTGIQAAEGFDVLDQVYRYIKQYHYDTHNISDKELLYGASKGLAQGTGDEFTIFFDPVGFENFTTNLGQDYVGIGVYIDVLEPGKVVILSPLKGTPSEEAGLLPGDQILQIDDYVVDESTSAKEAASHIKGPAGTNVNLKILRGTKTLDIEVERRKIHISFVTDEKIDSSNYLLTMTIFGFGSDSDFRNAIQRFYDSGAEKLIIDLRSNPGGGLAEAQKMLSLFVDKRDPVVVVKTQKQTVKLLSPNEKQFDLSEKKVVLLINEGSASASEIFAATLKEYYPDNVRIMGGQSFGKGTVQQLIQFNDSSSLKITTAKWFTGKNEQSIDKVGITPDAIVELREDLLKSGFDTQLEQAKKIRF